LYLAGRKTRDHPFLHVEHDLVRLVENGLTRVGKSDRQGSACDRLRGDGGQSGRAEAGEHVLQGLPGDKGAAGEFGGRGSGRVSQCPQHRVLRHGQAQLPQMFLARPAECLRHLLDQVALTRRGAMPATTTISADAPVATLINVFTVEAARQRELVDLLVLATEEVMQHLPGFIAANIHASADGTKVVNYAQWESAEAFHAMLDTAAAQVHMRQAAAIADQFDPHLYTVESVHHR
jgi:heme-degrading monooxygenase HmoA